MLSFKVAGVFVSLGENDFDGERASTEYGRVHVFANVVRQPAPISKEPAMYTSPLRTTDTSAIRFIELVVIIM